MCADSRGRRGKLGRSDPRWNRTKPQDRIRVDTPLARMCVPAKTSRLRRAPHAHSGHAAFGTDPVRRNSSRATCHDREDSLRSASAGRPRGSLCQQSGDTRQPPRKGGHQQTIGNAIQPRSVGAGMTLPFSTEGASFGDRLESFRVTERRGPARSIEAEPACRETSQECRQTAQHQPGLLHHSATGSSWLLCVSPCARAISARCGPAWHGSSCAVRRQRDPNGFSVIVRSDALAILLAGQERTSDCVGLTPPDLSSPTDIEVIRGIPRGANPSRSS